MEELSHFGPRIIMSFAGGKVVITETIFTSLILCVLIVAVTSWMAAGLRKQPTKRQVIAEFIVEMIYKLVNSTMGARNMKFAPYIGTIIIYILLGNMLGLFGFRPITADVNTTFALSTITFFLIEYNSFRSMGLKGKLKHMCDPYPFMFPLKIIESLSRPISLGFRLFGNILGGVVVMELVMIGLAGIGHKLSISIPIFQIAIPLPANFFFDMFEPVVQAFIFTMLTMVFITIEMASHGDEEHH